MREIQTNYLRSSAKLICRERSQVQTNIYFPQSATYAYKSPSLSLDDTLAPSITNTAGRPHGG